MDHKRLKALEEKYWSGQTDSGEEELLKKLALQNADGLSSEFKDLMAAASDLSELQLPVGFDDSFWQKADRKGRGGGKLLYMHSFSSMRSIAAAIAILLTVSGSIYLATRYVGMNDNQSSTASNASEDTFQDPEEAYEATRKALLMVSSRFNEAEKPVSEIKRFHQSTMSISGNMGAFNTKKEDKP